MEISEVNPDGNVYQLKDTTARTDIAQIKSQNVYSTEETDTGETWIDGKAIYRKVFTGSFSVSAGGQTTLVTSANMPSISALVEVQGLCSTNNINWILLGDATTRLYIDIGASSKNIAMNSEIARTNQRFTIVLKYTKA